MAPRPVTQAGNAQAQRRSAGKKMSPQRARSRLIFALDVASLKEVDHYVTRLADEVGLFKVGKQLFVHAGPEVVRRIQAKGGRVFLDLKFHDIPQTVASASVEATRLGVKMFTLHASGGADMLRQARKAVRTLCRAEQLTRPTLLAVTVLTSLSRDDLRHIGVRAGPAAQVVRLAQLAQLAGMDGLVASPQEIAVVRRTCRDKLTLVIPGVRPQGSTANDQKRIMTPHQAMQAGANYLVVGRPIRDAADPRQAARAIVEDMVRGLNGSTD